MKATFEFCVEIPLDQNTEWPVVVPPVPATRLVEGRYGWAWVPIDQPPRCDHCGKLVYPSLLRQSLGFSGVIVLRKIPQPVLPATGTAL